MKKFTIPGRFGDQIAPFNVYLGNPTADPPDTHPIEQQAAWLMRERGGVISDEVMEHFSKLLEIARDNKVSFEDVFVNALGVRDQETSATEDSSLNAG